MKEKPYVGVTGVRDKNEVVKVANYFEDNGFSMNSNYVPMLGYLVSYKTLNGKTVENLRYPEFNDLPNMLAAAENKVLTMVHYNTKELDNLSEQVKKIFSFGDIYDLNLCRSIQLNIPWPPVKQIRNIKKDFDNMKIVLQLSEKATRDMKNEEIYERCYEYVGLVDYILIDPSGGRGLEFDIKKSIKLYSGLKEKMKVTVGFAGGFNHENVISKVRKICEELGHKNFCIDAESGLRDKKSEKYGDDNLNLDKARAYIKNSADIFLS